MLERKYFFTEILLCITLRSAFLADYLSKKMHFEILFLKKTMKILFKRPILFPIFLISVLFMACSGDDDANACFNNTIPNVPVNLEINTNLPQFNNLQFPGNNVILENFGVNGIVVNNVNGSLFTAFELTDPNRNFSSCSKLVITGVEASNSCDDDNNRYNIITGQQVAGTGGCGLRPYRINISGGGSILLITN